MLEFEEKAGFIQNILFRLLQNSTQGLSEYELIQAIKEDIFDEDVTDLFRDTHKLFTVHFIIFHNLYRLKQELSETRTGHLLISPLNICIKPYIENESKQLADPDPLRDYYLDVSNLHDTTQQDVDELLQSFWLYFLATGDKQSAMDILEIDEPFDRQSLTQQYRKMVMRHHPDRGGNTTKLQEINNALQVLKRCLR
jgi:hypothetical protein